MESSVVVYQWSVLNTNQMFLREKIQNRHLQCQTMYAYKTAKIVRVCQSLDCALLRSYKMTGVIGKPYCSLVLLQWRGVEMYTVHFHYIEGLMVNS